MSSGESEMENSTFSGCSVHQSSSNITEKLAVSNLQKIWAVASLDDQMRYFTDQISKMNDVFILMPNFGILPKFSIKTSHIK